MGDRRRPRRSDRFRQPFQPIAHHNADVLDTAIFNLGQHLLPVLRALRAGTDPQPEDVTLTIDSDSNSGIDRPVRDLAISDLDDDTVDEHDGVHAIEWAVLPLRHTFQHSISDPADHVFRNLGAIDLGKMRRHLAGGQPLRHQGTHHVVHPRQPALTLAHQLGLEAAIAIPRYLELDRAGLGDHRFRPSPITGVATVASGCFVRLVPEMFPELRLETGFEHQLGQLAQQSVRTSQARALCSSMIGQLARELFVQLITHLPRA